MGDLLGHCGWCGNEALSSDRSPTDENGVTVTTYACLSCGASHQYVTYAMERIDWSSDERPHHPGDDGKIPSNESDSST